MHSNTQEWHGNCLFSDCDGGVYDDAVVYGSWLEG